MIPKFRAWHKPMQRISEVFAISFERQKVKIRHVRGTTHMTVPFDDVVLMQSTGLFDENGKEIFEGDVVELHHFTENYSTTGGFYEGEESLVGVVRYGYTDDEIKYFGKVYPPRWFLENRYRKLDFSDLGGLHEESFKVIGDIYQNPELVEKME